MDDVERLKVRETVARWMEERFRPVSAEILQDFCEETIRVVAMDDRGMELLLWSGVSHKDAIDALAQMRFVMDRR